MPSLSKDQLAAIYTANVTDWSLIKSAQSGSTATVSDVLSPALTDNTVYVERRVATSGTQLGFQAYFSGEGCLAAPNAFVTGDVSTSKWPSKSYPAPTVGDVSGGVTAGTTRANSGSGDVLDALISRNATGHAAIGLVSTEKATSASTDWHFIKINGFAPTVMNVVKGNYDLFYESTLQYRGSTVGGASGLVLTQKTVADKIVSLLGNPASVSLLDASSGFAQTFGVAGLVGNAVANVAAQPQPPYTASGVLSNPVATSTRGPGGTPNACLSPVKIGDGTSPMGQPGI